MKSLVGYVMGDGNGTISVRMRSSNSAEVASRMQGEFPPFSKERPRVFRDALFGMNSQIMPMR